MDQNVFKHRVIPLFTLSIVVSAIGAFIGLLFPDIFGNGIVFIILAAVELILLLLLYTIFTTLSLRLIKQSSPSTPHSNSSAAIITFYLFTFIGGLILTPILILAISIDAMLIPEALVITSIVFIGISAYAYFSKKDFTFLGGLLRVLLIIGIVAAFGVMISSFFIAFDFIMADLIMSSFFALLFAAWTLYDMSAIMLKYSNDDYIPAIIALYIDFLNLFVNILSILIDLKKKD